MLRLTSASALCLTFALPLAIPASCLAQQSSLFSSGSTAGGASTGGSTARSSGSSMGGSSSGGMGTTGGMSSQMGGRSTSSTSGGRSATSTAGGGGVQEPQFNQFGSVGNSIGQGSFVGRSDNSGRFVGQGQAGQQGNLGTRGLGQMGGMGRGQNGAGNQNNNNNNNRGGNTAQSQRKVRPQLKVAFPVNQVPTTTVATSLQKRMSTETLTAGTLRNVQLKMSDEGVVTLSGSVENQDARSLAAAMVRLEPGVRKVVNELTVPE